MTRRVAALALAIVLLVVVGIGAASRIGDDHVPARPATTLPRNPVVRDVETFVSQARQLQFKREVPVTLLTGDAFKQRLLADADEQRDQIALAQRSLRAVGLIGANVDLDAVLKRFVGDAVVGFYDARRHELVVRGTTFSPYARTVLAHELTHALDDQWFGIDRKELDAPGNDEAAAAFQALTEGNAVRIQERFLASLPPADRDAANAEDRKAASSIDLKGVPVVVREVVAWPYQYGPGFVDALARAGGERRVDDALRDPPTTTEQIVDPDAYLTKRALTPVPPPRADGPVLDKGYYGYSSLVETLEPVVGTDDATRAADGWAGDAYVLWDAGGGRTCVRATFAMRTATDLKQLTSSLETWAADRKATVERQPGTVTFTSCG